MTQFILPKTLAKLTQGQTTLQVEGVSLFENLQALTSTYGLDDALVDASGRIQPYIRVMLGNELVAAASPEELAAVATGDQTVQIKTAFAGG